ncbi:MAG TPA: triose-phosphate isomerase [Bacilli bacterium]|nr:triose-phosphate isomerase [Bacilli bacterium]
MKKVILNLKMNLVLEEIKKYEEEIALLCDHNPEVIICPSYPFLYLFKNPNYYLGAQDASQFIEGSYTGEVSAKQLASMGVKHVIINHSERKKIVALSNDVLLSKIKNILNNNMQVILCVSETIEERKSHKTVDVLLSKIVKLFNQLNREDIKKITIAYEPEWAIGTGTALNYLEVDEIAKVLKSEIFRMYEKYVDILYGGSVNSYNITNLSTTVNIDGFLIGKASLDMKEINDILSMCKEKY